MYKPIHLRKRYTCSVLEPEKPKEEHMPKEMQEEIEYISVPKAKKKSKYLPGERLLRSLHKEQKKIIDVEVMINNSVDNILDII